jgi:hypothetical protein
VLLVKTCLASIHVYLLSFFKFPSGLLSWLIPRWPVACGMTLKDIGSYICPAKN